MLLGVRGYAKHRGVAPSAVTKAVQTGRIVRDKNGMIDTDLADQAWAQNTEPSGKGQQKANATGPSPPTEPTTLAMERMILVRTQRRKAELELAKMQGSVLDASMVAKEAFELARRVRDRLLSIPDRVGSILAAETDPRIVREMLSRELRSALEELANSAPS